ncbi:hypothetical protein DACRYDRAFT_20538 [Dacryopinax primogenitus]|uniref:Uncharacterized protein n=1 Tax=Dacryopinax primogenitus (strain DJM 731) TaxID=1858805 RepID=M5G9L7_DACPD|nr:uncharacterized protein DACRYDRAFT_20538 [Dacryopinax primogenitus]EJU04965.1 hypothetical protein DACRYDRAFT_20538 [Dacryopinax primogenitus]
MFALVVRNVPRVSRRAVAPLAALPGRYYTGGGNVHGNDPHVIEKELNRNKTKHGEMHESAPHNHAPGWNELLASESEADIKADKAEGTPAELQRSTVDFLKAKEKGNKDT